MSVQHFDDNYNYHDASGDGGYAADWVFGGAGHQPEHAPRFGLYHCNDIPPTDKGTGSQTKLSNVYHESKYSTFTHLNIGSMWYNKDFGAFGSECDLNGDNMTSSTVGSLHFHYHFELIPTSPISIEIGGHWYENVNNACGIFAPFIEHVQANSGSQARIK